MSSFFPGLILGGLLGLLLRGFSPHRRITGLLGLVWVASLMSDGRAEYSHDAADSTPLYPDLLFDAVVESPESPENDLFDKDHLPAEYAAMFGEDLFHEYRDTRKLQPVSNESSEAVIISRRLSTPTSTTTVTALMYPEQMGCAFPPGQATGRGWYQAVDACRALGPDYGLPVVSYRLENAVLLGRLLCWHKRKLFINCLKHRVLSSCTASSKVELEDVCVLVS